MSKIFKSNKLLKSTLNILNKSQFSYAHKIANQIESEKQELFLDRENCILVNEQDKNIGFASKRDCHRVEDNGIKLHRAFSVFLFNKSGEMLLQKRSNHKVSTYSTYCCREFLSCMKISIKFTFYKINR